jgi:acylphosphatase
VTGDGADAAVAVRVVIRGRVQGVWFRAWTEEQAVARGLAGWVRNRADGTVEALFAGPPSQVEDVIRVCHDGPPLARVDAVQRFPATVPERPGFSQQPTR